MSNWEKNLRKGEWFESNVTKPWLLSNRSNYWITDSRNHVRLQGRGPRITNGKNEITLPDFRLDDPLTGESYWLDSKLKNSPFSISGYPGEIFYSIDPRSYDEYMKLLSIFTKMRFEILLGCITTNKVYLFDLQKNQPVMHIFQNQYVRNNRNKTPCFSTVGMQEIGKWDSSKLPN